MKGMKFRTIIEKDENGVPVRRFVPCDDQAPEPECFLYGNYMVAEEDQIQQAKEELLKGMFDVIKKVSEDDRFWIVKKLEDNKYTVAWKIEFTHMYFNEQANEENKEATSAE